MKSQKNWRVRRTLAHFAPGTGRDLFFKRGDFEERFNGTKRTGRADIFFEQESGFEDRMKAAYEQAGGGAAGAAAAEKVYDESFKVIKSAVIIVAPDASNFVVLHELGHVDQAVNDPLQYKADAAEAAQLAGEDYGDSRSEDIANQYANQAKKNEPEEPEEE